MKIILKTMPPALNATYKSGRGGKFYKSKDSKTAQDAIRWEIRSQYRGKLIEHNVAVEIVFYWKDKRRDIDSGLKSLLDALTGIVWKDDRQVIDLHVWKEVDKENPRVELDIFPD